MTVGILAGSLLFWSWLLRKDEHDEHGKPASPICPPPQASVRSS